MKCVIVINRFHPFIGGRESQVKILAQELERRGWTIEVLTEYSPRVDPRRHGRTLSRLWTWLILMWPRKTVRKLGNITIRYPRLTFADKLWTFFRAIPQRPSIRFLRWGTLQTDRAWARRYRQMFDGAFADADVVHLHDQFWGFMQNGAAKTAKRKGVPYVVTPYFHKDDLIPEMLDSIFGKYIPLLKQAAHIFYLLPAEKRIMQKMGVKTPSTLCGIGVIVDERKRPVASTETPSILFLGRIARQKNVHHLIEAAEILFAKYPNLKVKLVGPFEMEDSTFLCNLHPNISYLGRVSDEERKRQLAECTMLCLPSTSEVFPNAIAEAWTYEKPVVSYPAYALAELITKAKAGIVTDANPQALAKGIAYLLKYSVRAKTMGKAGHKLVKSRYTHQHFTDIVETAYEACIKKRTKRAA